MVKIINHITEQHVSFLLGLVYRRLFALFSSWYFLVSAWILWYFYSSSFSRLCNSSICFVASASFYLLNFSISTYWFLVVDLNNSKNTLDCQFFVTTTRYLCFDLPVFPLKVVVVFPVSFRGLLLIFPSQLCLPWPFPHQNWSIPLYFPFPFWFFPTNLSILLLISEFLLKA